MGKLFEANFGAKICVFVLDHVAGERNQLIMAINQSTGCIPRPAAAPPVSADSKLFGAYFVKDYIKLFTLEDRQTVLKL